jgi:hypothetical protein
MQTIIKNRVMGILSFFYVFNDGRWEFIRRIQNEIMYSGADLMAQAIVGKREGFIRGMYMEYSNGTPPAPAVSRDRAPVYYEGLGSPEGYIRVPLTAQPGYTPSTTDYQGNIVTVQAQTDGTYENGPGIVDGTSQIYAAALVAMPNPDDKSEDILFSAANTDAPIPKIANAQVGIKWDIKFL